MFAQLASRQSDYISIKRYEDCIYSRKNKITNDEITRDFVYTFNSGIISPPTKTQISKWLKKMVN